VSAFQNKILWQQKSRGLKKRSRAARAARTLFYCGGFSPPPAQLILLRFLFLLEKHAKDEIARSKKSVNFFL